MVLLWHPNDGFSFFWDLFYIYSFGCVWILWHWGLKRKRFRIQWRINCLRNTFWAQSHSLGSTVLVPMKLSVNFHLLFSTFMLLHGSLMISNPFQFSSVAQSCPTLCNPMDCSMPGLPVYHQLPVCSNSCALSQWCYPTISSSVIPFSFCLQSFPAQVAKVLEFQLQQQSFQWIFRTDFL